MSPKVSESYKNDKVNYILEAAERVFIRRGFDETTMQDIVDECSISRGGLYRYFSSTDEIFKTILEKDMSHNEDFFSKFIADGWNAMDILKAFVEAEKSSILNVRNTLIPAAYEFFMRSMRKNKDPDYLIKRRNAALKNLSAVIDYGIRRGEFSTDLEPLEASNFIINFFEGLIITALSAGMDEAMLSGQIRIFNEFMFFYLKNKRL